jgi:mannose-6-phosphate isomerase
VSSVPQVIELDNPVREYAWGSYGHIPRLLGHPPTGRPVAELWIGAHPDSPSQWADIGLDVLIAAAPERLLGTAAVQRFGPRLPFLMKLLAAERPLSLQVHPNQAQAQAGFQAEQDAGVALDSIERSYSDPYAKPELAYALTDFEAFCGFRPVAATAEYLDALGVPELAHYRELLIGEGGLRATFTTLLTLRGEARELVVAATLAGCRRLTSGPWAAAARASVMAGEAYEGDIGPVLALLLNHVRLAPGEAIFLGAGNVHSYLHGLCVEVLANSDNVLRCGLTAKHVDVPELLRIADFEPLAEPRWRPAAGVASFRPPVPDFRLDVLQLGDGAGELTGDRPWLVLAGARPVRLADVVLAPWHAAFVGAGGATSVTGADRAFAVTAGEELAPR